jgi:hypothetical protein
MLPEGLVLFAGRQKTGKTWLVLDLGHAVGSGATFIGRPCNGGNVLLILLEDNPRRVQNRLRKMQIPGSPGVQVFNAWPRGANGIKAIIDWIEQAHDPRLVCIDTLKRFIGTASHVKGDAYERAVELHAPLQQAALAARIPIIATTHERKDTRGDDWMDRITGSLGLASVADTVVLLTRERDQPSALLRITGRDVEDIELSLVFDRKSCRWTTLDRHPAVQAALLASRKSTRDLLGIMIEDNVARSAAEWAIRRGLARQNVDRQLRDLECQGAVVKSWQGSTPLWQATPTHTQREKKKL